MKGKKGNWINSFLDGFLVFKEMVEADGDDQFNLSMRIPFYHHSGIPIEDYVL